jgi:hypothetical protein
MVASDNASGEEEEWLTSQTNYVSFGCSQARIIRPVLRPAELCPTGPNADASITKARRRRTARQPQESEVREAFNERCWPPMKLTVPPQRRRSIVEGPICAAVHGGRRSRRPLEVS